MAVELPAGVLRRTLDNATSSAGEAGHEHVPSATALCFLSIGLLLGIVARRAQRFLPFPYTVT